MPLSPSKCAFIEPDIPWPGIDSNCYVRLTNLPVEVKNKMKVRAKVSLDYGMRDQYAWRSESNEIVSHESLWEK